MDRPERGRRSPESRATRHGLVADAGAAALAALLLLTSAGLAARTRLAVEVIDAVGGLPAHIVGAFEEPVGFVQTTTGDYLVLDRRAHTVYGIDPARTGTRKVLQIGFEQGRVLQPAVLALSRDDVFAVADAPSGLERIQYFATTGTFLGGFYLSPHEVLSARVVRQPLVLSGAGTMSFTGRTFLVNRPETGALIRKYDAAGTLLFERHIEGAELDGDIQSLPTEWPSREAGGGRHPVVPPLVRTAAVDAAGRLWISLTVPFTYVYDRSGDKVKVVQFHAAGTIAPQSLFFSSRGRLLVTPGCYEFPVPKD